jgi:general secretion pathway protein G
VIMLGSAIQPSRPLAARTRTGFSLVELLVVLAAMALLLSVVVPRYAEHVDRSRETVLRHNLLGIREAIDKFYADRQRYPKELQELVAERYLRQIPLDPVTDKADTWLLLGPGTSADRNAALATAGVRPSGAGAGAGAGAGMVAPPAGVFDVRSGAVGNARDGTPYASW